MKITQSFCAVLFFCFVTTLQATPYASGISNAAGTVSFILNESADSVRVIFDGGASTNDLGALAAGRHSFPLGTATSFRIVVQKSSAPGYTVGVTNKISDDTSTRNFFFIPNGVAVNKNPASPYFGRVYVAEGQGGTTTVPGARTTTDGIYILNADLSDAVGQGDTARRADIDFTRLVNNRTPWKIEVGDDDNLYIADYSTNGGGIWVTDPDVLTGTNALEGIGAEAMPAIHTTISSSPIATGSLTGANLTLWAIDGRWTGSGGRNSLLQWDIGAGPLPATVTPTYVGNAGNSTVNDVYCDVDRGPDGKYYVLQNRFDGVDTDSLRVFEPGNTTRVWGSLEVSGSPDVLRQIRAVKVSPDGQRIALNRNDGRTWIIGLTNGFPDLTATNLVDTFVSGNGNGRDIAFDIAGNLYVINSSVELLRVFSPGGTTTAITGSDGTFSLISPAPVSVTAEDADGHEANRNPVSFNIQRGGSTNAPLRVRYTLTGTATNASDYATNELSVVIAAGQTNVVVTITPTDDDIAERTEDVILTIVGTIDYNPAAPSRATAYISDNEVATLTISATDSNAYERFPTDQLVFTIEKLGDTNASQFCTFQFSGSAQLDVDYSRLLPETLLYIPEGVTSTNLVLVPVDDFVFEGDETVIVTLLTNDYAVGTPGSASARIVEDEFAPVPMLFSDNFDTDSSADWILRFGAGNDIEDYSAEWAFDYSTLGIPPAPGSGGTNTVGLRLRVNKNDATTGGSAGINFYPTSAMFSGDYALRFDLYLSVGTSSTTEHALAGINHSGDVTNRSTQSTGAAGVASTRGADGIWVGIVTDASNLRDWGAYTSTNSIGVPHLITNRAATTLTNQIPRPPYSFAGSPGNTVGSTTKAWVDVELSQVGDVISLRANKHLIFQFTNTFGFNTGKVMIGYNDQFDSPGHQDTFAIFDNARVVRLGAMPGVVTISGIQVTNNMVHIDFTSAGGGQPGDFQIESTPTLSPPTWSPESAAAVTPSGNGFRANLPASGTMRFYRVRQ